MKKLCLFLIVLLLHSGIALAGLDPNANTFPVSEDRIEIKATVFGARTEIIDWDTNDVTLWWEDKLNADIVWTIIPTATAAEMVTATMASGDLPDVMFGGLNKDTIVAYGAQGYLLPLNDLIEKWGYNIKQLFELNNMLEGSLTAPDGNIYFLPTYVDLSMDHTAAPGKMLMNTTWLKNVGMDIPNNVDELYKVLKAFKEQDANGNGDPNDEIPLLSVGINRIGSYIMQAFTYLGFTDVAPNYFYVEDGEIKVSYTQDGWREGLAYMAKLYAEGLMDPECFVADAASAKMLTGAEGGNRVGASEHYAWSGFIDLNLVDVANQFEFIPPLENKDGVRVTPGSKATIVPGFCISADSKVAEAAFRWGDAMLMDTLADDLAGMPSLYGPENEGWRRAKEGEFGPDGKTPALYERMFTWGEPNNINLHETSLIRYSSAQHKIRAATKPKDANSFDQDKAIMVGTIDYYLPYAVYKTAPNLIMFAEDEVMEASQLTIDIETYVKEAETAFITGNTSIDTGWDDYLAQLETLGLSRLLELYQIAYDRQFK